MDTNRQRIQAVTKLLEAMQATLNRTKAPCGHCGCLVRENWSQEQTAETLGAVNTRLNRVLTHRDLQDWLDQPAPSP